MKLLNIDAARRLDRLVRWQFLFRGVLLTGWLMIILGVIAVSMTVSLTPDQLADRLSTNPKLFLSILPWITAPPNFRIFGAALFVLGMGLVAIAHILISRAKSRTAAMQD
jgi:hypothetical protein